MIKKLEEHIALLNSIKYCYEQWQFCNDEAHKLCNEYNLGKINDNIHEVIYSEFRKLMDSKTKSRIENTKLYEINNALGNKIDELELILNTKNSEIKTLRASDTLLKEIENSKKCDLDMTISDDQLTRLIDIVVALSRDGYDPSLYKRGKLWRCHIVRCGNQWEDLRSIDDIIQYFKSFLKKPT